MNKILSSIFQKSCRQPYTVTFPFMYALYTNFYIFFNLCIGRVLGCHEDYVSAVVEESSP